MTRHLVCTFLALSFMLTPETVQAASFKISIGIRETNDPGDIFGDGGVSNGIEFVNRDGQTLTADGTWQLFTFTPASDTLIGFAGTTANSVLEPGHEWAVLENIRILNDENITRPIRLWIDDITNTLASGPVVHDFETATLGSEVMFRAPGFSGSTSAFVEAGSLSAVSSSAANSGTQSLQMDFQFVEDTPDTWARITTFNTPNQPNPRIRVRLPGAPNPTVSFYARALVIPEPASLMLLGLAGIGLVGTRTRR